MEHPLREQTLYVLFHINERRTISRTAETFEDKIDYHFSFCINVVVKKDDSDSS